MKSKKPSGSNANRVTVELTRDEAIYITKALEAHAGLIADTATKLGMEFDPERQARVLRNVSIRIKKVAGLGFHRNPLWGGEEDDDIPF